MRQRIESESKGRGWSGGAAAGTIRRLEREFVYGGGWSAARLTRGLMLLGLVVALLLSAPRVSAESAAGVAVGQSGALQGAGAHGGSSGAAMRGVPPHAPGYLGTLFQDVSEEQAAALHLKSGSGVVVQMVDHDGPAGKAGLEPQDVIVSLNGQEVEGAAAMRKMIRDAGVGADVSLVVLRDGQKMVIHARLAYRGEVEREAMLHMAEVEPDVPPAGSLENGAGTDPAAPEPLSRSRRFLMQMLHTTPYTGLLVANMAPQLGEFFGAPAGVGVLVESVETDSPAAAAGLRAGDVILKADAIEIHSTSAWVLRLHRSRGRGMVLVVLRDRQEQTKMLTPEGRKP
ncbi:MAG: PDZ domain-containing protein [Acidobacteriaceae bacterium]